jgi:hypothetical protein
MVENVWPCNWEHHHGRKGTGKFYFFPLSGKKFFATEITEEKRGRNEKKW